MARTKTIDRDRILDAAEQVIFQNGVRALTLDMVAARAAISKGGLTYTFRSKEALLSAMLYRQLDRIQQGQREYTAAHEDAEFPEVEDFAARSRQKTSSIRQTMVPTLAALAHSAESLNAARSFNTRCLARLPRKTLSGRRARIVYMCLNGMFFMQGLDILRLDAGARNALLDDLTSLLHGGQL